MQLFIASNLIGPAVPSAISHASCLLYLAVANFLLICITSKMDVGVCCLCCPNYCIHCRQYSSSSKWERRRLVRPVVVTHQPRMDVHTSARNLVNLSKPTMPNLLFFPSDGKSIDVPLTIASKGYDLCISLLMDEDGSKFSDMQNRHSNNGYREVNCEILERWLQGGGRPVDWKTLVETLRDIELGELAQQIEVGVLKWKQCSKDKLSLSLP